MVAGEAPKGGRGGQGIDAQNPSLSCLSSTLQVGKIGQKSCRNAGGEGVCKDENGDGLGSVKISV